MNKMEDALPKLLGLTDFLEKRGDPKARFLELAEAAAEILNARHCSITFFAEKSAEEGPRIFSWPDQEGDETVLAAQVAALQEVAAGGDLIPALAGRRLREATVPILAGTRVAGLLHIEVPRKGRYFSASDLHLLSLAALLLGKSLEVMELKDLLQSRLVHVALVLGKKSPPGTPLQEPRQDLGKIAKIVAKTFYQEMRKAGFGTQDIVRAATEILSLLGEGLKKDHSRDRPPPKTH